MELLDIITDLSRVPGPAGFEGAATKAAEEFITPFVDEVRTDALGSVIALKRCGKEGAKKLMLCAHIDEIGLIVTGYEKGFLRIDAIGGMDGRALPASRVKVLTREPIYGIVDVLPPHVLSAEDSDKVIEMDKLFVNVGLGEEEVKARVPLGTPVVPDASCERLGAMRLSGRALDDRAGCAILVKTLELLSGKALHADIYAVFSTQEELGSRGATTSAFSLAPDACIALDVTFGAQPGTKPEGTFKLGGGPAIAVGPNVNRALYRKLVSLCKERDIPYQTEVLAGHSGTDAWAVQVSREGVRTALISPPIRYMHSPVETIDLRDTARCAELLAAFCEAYGDES